MALRRPPGSAELDALELQLRKLPGIVGVGFSGAGPDLTVHLATDAGANPSTTWSSAEELVRFHLGAPVSLVIAPAVGLVEDDAVVDLEAHRDPPADVSILHPAAGDPEAARDEPPTVVDQPAAVIAEPAAIPDEAPVRAVGAQARTADVPLPLSARPPGAAEGARVRLLGVSVADDPLEVEVHLGYEDKRTVGRAPGDLPSSAAGATLEALRLLAFDVPFRLRSAVHLAFGMTGAVTVLLEGPGGERLGISRSGSSQEAAARATLHALNRHLGQRGALGAA